MHQSPRNQFYRSAACPAVLTALLLLFPAHVSAIPIAEYQQQLKNAIATLEKLVESDEDETISDYEKRFDEALDSVRATLPSKQTVESASGSCNVDNSWLHKWLDKLKDEDDRFEQLEHVIENLRAIEARVAERQEAGQATENKDWAKTRLESILARPEFVSGARGPNALTRLIRDFMRWLQELFPKPAPGQAPPTWLNVVAKTAVIIAGVLLLLFIIRILMQRFKRTAKIKTRKKPEPRIVLGERLEPDQTSVDLLSEAEALARRGDLRSAIRKAYIALLVELGDRKIISLAQYKTNRDYLNALRTVPQIHSNMRGLTDSFERHWYGFVHATENDWQDFRNGYLATLQSGN